MIAFNQPCAICHADQRHAIGHLANQSYVLRQIINRPIGLRALLCIFLLRAVYAKTIEGTGGFEKCFEKRSSNRKNSFGWDGVLKLQGHRTVFKPINARVAEQTPWHCNRICLLRHGRNQVMQAACAEMHVDKFIHITDHGPIA